MDKQGKIVKVSGPLVEAVGMDEAKMYDVVKVGEQRLIGEIIRLSGEKAYIQVYEETEGLGPGDPVFLSGEPLIVELGPGLLDSIYDGIQRPLGRIREETGDYIGRGLTINALPREKKWNFKPLVKKGEAVEAGDILGKVEETPLVEHRIMVPLGIKGKVDSIKEGSFTVEEEIAKINGKSIAMLSRWPVRNPRPFKERLAPVKPLVTGQRVIDSLFPVTKGGTACIPGPFGSGKCITGDTPILLADGCLKNIEEIYTLHKNQGEKVKNLNEEYTILRKPFEVFSYLSGKIRKSKVRAVYKGKTERIITIKMKSGKTIKITPIHRLFKVNGDLNISETKASNLKEGDYLIAPRTIPLEGNIQNIPIFEIFGAYRVCDEKILKTVPKLIDKLVQKYGTKVKVAERLNISYTVLTEYWNRRNRPTLNFVRRLYQEVLGKKPEIRLIKGATSSKVVKMPKLFNKEISLVLGLLLADGTFKQRSIRFYNNDKDILNLFENLVKKLFGLSIKRGMAKTVKCAFLESGVVVKLLKYFGYPEYRKSRNIFIPDILLRSPASVINSFLGAYFICDGYFSQNKGEIEFSSASEKIQTGLAYLLLRLGILYRVSSKIVKGAKYYRLFIPGHDEVEKFYQYCHIERIAKFLRIKEYLKEGKVNYPRADVVPLGKKFVENIYKKYRRPYQKLKDGGVEIFNYLMGELMTKRMFEKFSSILNNKRLLKFAFNDLQHIYCDRIVKIEELNQPTTVYDLEIPSGHNFVGGNGPMFFHNTVVLHQIAKWADSQVIVYIGCGERGNEMADVLLEFPKLNDPKTGRPLTERTILIANTSNMPVAAREASIYTGITIGEYYRDMGYDVALMADSTSRWAEALREISGRMEEMPGEEGYPAYLGTRVASFYERAGRVVNLGSKNVEGTLSVIGAVSPPGGDLTDPVVQQTLRVVKVFWGLDERLAYQRHFPAINWLTSYSLHTRNLQEFLKTEIGEEMPNLRETVIEILQREAEILEIVRLVGMETISEEDKLLLETARTLREDFLHQSAFDEKDAYTTLSKQYRMVKIIFLAYDLFQDLLKKGIELKKILALPIREKIAKIKYIPEENLKEFDALEEELEKEVKNI